MIWTIYHLEFRLSLPMLLAIVIYGAGSLLISKLRRKKEGSSTHTDVVTIGWTVAWSFLYFGALFAIYLLIIRLFNAITVSAIAGDTGTSGFGLRVLYMVVCMIAIVLAVWLVGMFIALQETTAKATIRRWYETPLIGYMLVIKRGQSYIGSGLLAVIMIGLALLAEYYHITGYGGLQGFLLLLLSVSWLLSVNHQAAGRTKGAQGTFKPLRAAKLVGLTILFLMLAAYGSLFLRYYGPFSSFISGVILMMLIYLICYAFVKLRLFSILKWLMLLAVFPFFGGWLLLLWLMA